MINKFFIKLLVLLSCLCAYPLASFAVGEDEDIEISYDFVVVPQEQIPEETINQRDGRVAASQSNDQDDIILEFKEKPKKDIEYYEEKKISYDRVNEDYEEKIAKWDEKITTLRIQKAKKRRVKGKPSYNDEEEAAREKRKRIVKEEIQKFKSFCLKEKEVLNELLEKASRQDNQLVLLQGGYNSHLEGDRSEQNSSLKYTAMYIFLPDSLLNNFYKPTASHISVLKSFDEKFYNAQVVLRKWIKDCPKFILYPVAGSVVIAYGTAFFIAMTGMENNFVGNLLKTPAEGTASIATFVISGLVNFPFGSLLSYYFIKKLLFKKEKSFKPLPPIDEDRGDKAYVFNQSWFEVIVKNVAGAGASLSLGALGGALWSKALNGFGLYEYTMLPIVMFGFGKPIWDFGRKEISRFFVRKNVSHDSEEQRRFLVFNLGKVKERIRKDKGDLTQNLWDRVQKQSGYFGKNKDFNEEYKISLLSTFILTCLNVMGDRSEQEEKVTNEVILNDEIQQEENLIDRTTLIKELPTSFENNMASKAPHIATGLFVVPGYAVDAGAIKVLTDTLGINDNIGIDIGYGLAAVAGFRLLLEFSIHKAAYKNWRHPFSSLQDDYPGIRRGLSLYSTFTGAFFATLLATVAYNVCKDYPSVILVPFVFITAFRYFTIFQQAASHLYHKAATAVFLRNNYDTPEPPKENIDPQRPRAGSINSDVHIQVNDDGIPQSLLQDVNEQAPLVANKVNEPTIQAKKAHLFEMIRKLTNHIKYKAADKTIKAIFFKILNTE